MQAPKDVAGRVEAGALRGFCERVGLAVGMGEGDAGVLAGLLVDSDLRGVVSHGSRQLTRYTAEMKSGRLNATPGVRCVGETAVSVTMDGDGGLGYFPAREGTRRVIEKAQAVGMAAMVSRNHGHIGAAGLYPRMALGHDLMAFCTSGVQLRLDPARPVVAAGGGSPMSFAVPGKEGPGLVFDAGVTHGVQGAAPGREALLAVDPGVVLRALGLGTVCQAWGGLLAGLRLDRPAEPRYPAANQGAFLYAFRIDLFCDPEELKREVDEYHRRVSALEPMPHTEGAYLPGGLEAEREAAYGRDGIPLGIEHHAELAALAERLGVALYEVR